MTHIFRSHRASIGKNAARALTAAMLFHVLANPAAHGAQPAATSTPRARALVDFTGQWVAVVTEDWSWRMLTAARGDFPSVPLNAEGIKVANAWDPRADAARGEECKPFGAAGIMRIPGRLRITWKDDSTLQIETDAGQQTRLLYFDDQVAPAASATWQGHSLASWDRLQERGRGLVGPTRGAGEGGAMTVVTTHLRAGYLRKNGVPYSSNAVLTEYFDRWRLPNGQEWMTVTSIVDDPTYLREPFITSTDFKREVDRSRWHPTDCVIAEPLLDGPARSTE